MAASGGGITPGITDIEILGEKSIVLEVYPNV